MMHMRVLGIVRFPCYLMKQEKRLNKWVLLLKMVLLVKIYLFQELILMQFEVGTCLKIGDVILEITQLGKAVIITVPFIIK